MPIKVIKLKTVKSSYNGHSFKTLIAKNIVGTKSIHIDITTGGNRDLFDEVYSKKEVDEIKEKAVSEIIQNIGNIIQEQFISLKENIINDPKLSKKVAEHMLNDNAFLEKFKNNS